MKITQGVLIGVDLISFALAIVGTTMKPKNYPILLIGVAVFAASITTGAITMVNSYKK